MFGQAPIHGRKTFKQDPPDTLRVHNAFFTLQGEGPLSGQPSVFLRLSHCNQQCSFCDTDYEQSNLMEFADVELYLQRKIIEHFRGNLPVWAQWQAGKSRHVNLVVTGGEPLLQTNLTQFFAWLAARSHTPEYKTIQIESNGNLPWIDPDAWSTRDVVLVVSPKCAERDGVATRYLKPHPTTLERADVLKFVVSADPTSAYHTVPDWALASNKPLYLSPMNIYHREPQAKLLAAKTNSNDLATRTALERVSFWEPGLLDQEANQKNHEHAAALCMQLGATLSLQTHLYASLP